MTRLNVLLGLVLVLQMSMITRYSLFSACEEQWLTSSVVKTEVSIKDKSGELIRSQFNKLTDKQLRGHYKLWTMTAKGRQNMAVSAIQRINKEGIEGAVVECGVWRGGMMMAMIFENMKTNIDREFWLFDTFEGLPEPDHVKDDPKAKEFFQQLKQNATLVENGHHVEDGKMNYGPLELVQHNLRTTGYPESKFHFVKGKVEDTLPHSKLPAKIALLRLDTDWYLSTKMELKYMYKLLQPGGLLIVDDFFSWSGAHTATVEFFKEKLGLDAKTITKSNFHYWKPRGKEQHTDKGKEDLQ
mmetsp:Transcript_13510/g.37326  ORF Transcript_13510/g.37326 Transcript_13510/m.37326 type:complete len:299 (-) Transcript_13510:1431-2327(-)